MLEIKDGQMTVQKLVDACSSFGIPHFQRGLVWNDDSVSLLLESLYFDTPIGSIVLWECDQKNQEDLGESLSGNGQSFDYLIIDGQQRLRCLRGVFPGKDKNTETSSHGNEESDDVKEGERIWCLNLRKVDSLKPYIDESGKDYPLFINVLVRALGATKTDPKTNRPIPSPFQYNFVPIKLIQDLDNREEEIRRYIEPKRNTTVDDVIKTFHGKDNVKNNIDDMTKRSVFVKKLEKDKSLAEVIRLYNRINSGGKRVEEEEMAFATLVSIDQNTQKRIADIFAAIHNPENEAGKSNGLLRDAALKRIKERNFGFKLFMRTFIQTCIYHFGSSPGSSGFSFTIMESEPFLNRLREQKEKINELWKITQDVIEYVRKVLREPLKCDSLQFLPETSSLLPVFQALIKYYPKDSKQTTGLIEWLESPVYKKKIAAICLQLLLFVRTGREIMEMVRKINNSTHTLSDALQYLKTSTEINPDKLLSSLENADSLQDRMILLLYWLLRNRGANDFSYEKNNIKAKKFFTGKKDIPIDELVKPEKQHIVPYSKLKKILNIEERTRISSHPANNIGNITYISHDLNSTDRGIGENALNLEDEPSDNLEKHLLSDLEYDVLSGFKEIIKPEDKDIEKDREKYVGKYNDLMPKRQNLIKKAFLSWINDLFDGEASDQIKPCERIFIIYKEFSIPEKIRDYKLPNELERALIGISSHFKEKRKSENSKKPLTIEHNKKYWLRIESFEEIKKFSIRINDGSQELANNLMEKQQTELADKIKTATGYISLVEAELLTVCESLLECIEKSKK